MYFLFPMLILLAILCSILFHFRKKQIICKIKTTSTCEKLCLLNKITEPFGFSYDLSKDIFISRPDSWQREFGYGQFYDENALHFNMCFDCEPIYFDYEGRTWLIEFWKGQYGINIGGEIGIYQADTIIDPVDYPSTLFHTVPDKDIPVFSYAIYKGTHLLYQLRSDIHWWLAGFDLGKYSEPEFLRMDITIHFGKNEMLIAFTKGLIATGYHTSHFDCYGNTTCLTFYVPKSMQPRMKHPFLARLAMWKNRFFLALYCFITKPFCCTLDKLLYLYEYIPFAFRHMLTLHPHKKRGGRR